MVRTVTIKARDKKIFEDIISPPTQERSPCYRLLREYLISRGGICHLISDDYITALLSFSSRHVEWNMRWRQRKPVTCLSRR